jgi:SdrD B-like domain
MKKIFLISSVLFLCFISTGFPQATISGRVFNDISGNNACNPGEELSNITVWLLDLNAVAPYYRVSPVQTATTAASGIYTFTNVAAGDYQVRVMQSTVPATITRAVIDNDSYPNGLTNVMGVTGTSTYANIDFGFAATAVAPSFSSDRSFQWNVSNDFINVTSKTYSLPTEIIGGYTINPTIAWTTDRTTAPGGVYGTNTYPQALFPSSLLGPDFPGNTKGGIHPADNTFQLIYGGAFYTSTNNDRQTTTIQFNVPVINTKFSIYDIDHADPQVSTGRIDHVKVTGYNNNVPVIPVLLNPSATPWNTVSGNTVYGFADYPLNTYTLPFNSQNEDHGTVNVYFPNTIDKIIIEYEEWAPVMLPGKGINDGTPPNLATNETSWSDRTNPTYRGISIGSIDYTVDAATITLPVRLKEFNTTSKNCLVTLNWETSFEANMDHFEIEYSKDGLNFLTIGNVTPTNNISGAKYNFIVPQNMSSGYYRLKMQDTDGKFMYSAVRSINIACNNNMNWSLSGNPIVAGNETIIQLFIRDESFTRGNVVVRDMTGKKLLQQPLSLQQGQHTITLKTSGLKSGTFIIGMYDKNNIPAGEMQKLIIQ